MGHEHETLLAEKQEDVGSKDVRSFNTATQ
jgi:hypothetical protein